MADKMRKRTELRQKLARIEEMRDNLDAKIETLAAARKPVSVKDVRMYSYLDGWAHSLQWSLNRPTAVELVLEPETAHLQDFDLMEEFLPSEWSYIFPEQVFEA